MFGTIVLPWLHYLAIMGMAGAAVAQIYLLKLAAQAEAVRILPRVDAFYGIAAALVFATGMARVWIGGKGADYYWHNGAFHGALTVFVLAALVSIVPTLRYRRWRRELDVSGALPDASGLRKTKMLVHMQLTALALVALLIVLVAKGYSLGNA